MSVHVRARSFKSLTRLIFQYDDMGLAGQAAARHLQGRLCVHLREAHFLEELIERVEREFWPALNSASERQDSVPTG